MNVTELNNYLEPLIKQQNEHTQKINTLDTKLNDYRTELAALKNKYDVTAIETEISKNNRLKNETKNKIMTIKYRYVAKIIFENICKQDEYFNRQDKIKNFFKWLYEKFYIQYIRDCNFIDYESYYLDHIQEYEKMDEELDLIYDDDDDNVYVEANYYFRGELDDRVRLIVPIYVLDSIENFEGKVNSYFEELKNKAEEEAKQQAIELEKKEYERYLELKEKYENN